MPSTSPVILILGAGPNIGQAVARTFAAKGYKVALAARSLREADSTDNQLHIASDFANPEDIIKAFTRVKEVLGIPSVVVYNGKFRYQKARGRKSAECPQPLLIHPLLPTTRSQSRWLLSSET